MQKRAALRLQPFCQKEMIMAKSPTAATTDAAPKSTAKAPRSRAATKTATSVKTATSPAPTKKSAVREQLGATRDTIKAEASRKAQQLRQEASTLAGTAGNRARDAANRGKDKAVETVGTIAKMLEDSAATVDTKFGKQYGDYARSAASTVAGLATSLDQKELDELAQQTRDFVKKSPAVAVGAAAVIGFVLARMLKGSSNNNS
jgi:ElaB/YqjD/DUF883 family membrane-anchored ribosome-binding protein